MRKVVASAFVSLDDVMQAPGGPQEDTTAIRASKERPLMSGSTPTVSKRWPGKATKHFWNGSGSSAANTAPRRS